MNCTANLTIICILTNTSHSHNREVPCARLIPSGPGYQSILPQNQVCPVTGSMPGTNLVSGDRYIELSFSYHYTHLWRNYGILIGYFMFFFVLYGLAVEFVPQVAKGKGDILIFLRHGRKAGTNNGLGKELQERNTENSATAASPNDAGFEKGFGKLERSRESFTWEKIEYQIPVKGGKKTLLTGIHGFVKPGSMTGRSPTPFWKNVLTFSLNGGIRSWQDDTIECSCTTNPYWRRHRQHYDQRGSVR